MSGQELDGKVAIVTGGANGIGLATVQRFVEEGARVVIADVDAERGPGRAAELGDAVAFREADVADPASVQGVVDFAVEHFGGLDVMCNNAAISGVPRRFMDDRLLDFQQVIAVDLFGVVVGSQCAAKHMAGHGGGVILNTTSLAGITPGGGLTAYRMAKAGVVHLTRCLALELAEHQIRVNCVAPGNIPTEINAMFDVAENIRTLQPLQRTGSPTDVAEAFVFLASDRAAQVTGHILPVDGGSNVGTPPKPS